jgi:hypothetical protein
MTDDELPTCEQFQSGIRAYEDNETRGWVYYEALAEVTVGWGQPNAMAAGVKRLLDAWHQAFYRFGAFDPVELEEAIAMRLASLESYRLRSISSLAEVDREGIGQLFEAFLDALRGGKRRSPVAVAKTLHLLAPEFFPLWDTEIAIGYGSWWWLSDFGASEYVPFCWKMKHLAERLQDCGCVSAATPKRSLLKLVDEYSYSRFTKRWI